MFIISPVRRPPETAVSLVDLCLHREIDSGERRRDTELQRGESQAEYDRNIISIIK